MKNFDQFYNIIKQGINQYLIQPIKKYLKEFGIQEKPKSDDAEPTDNAGKYEQQRKLFIEQQLKLDRYRGIPLSENTLAIDSQLFTNYTLNPSQYTSDVDTFSLVLGLQRLHRCIEQHELQTRDANLFYIADHLKRALDYGHMMKAIQATPEEEAEIIAYFTYLNQDIDIYLNGRPAQKHQGFDDDLKHFAPQMKHVN